MILLLFTAFAGKEVGLQAVDQPQPAYPSSLRGFPSRRSVDCGFTLTLSSEGEVKAVEPFDCPDPVADDLRPTLERWRYAPIGMITEHRVKLRMLAKRPQLHPELLQQDWLSARSALLRQDRRAAHARTAKRAGGLIAGLGGLLVSTSLGWQLAGRAPPRSAFLTSGGLIGIGSGMLTAGVLFGRNPVPELERWDQEAWRQLQQSAAD